MVEAAALLRLPVATMRHYRVNNIGPRGARLGRRVVYRRADVLAFIEQAFAAA
jgi:predicted DNA-binding transcriptional regulator AlpA